MGFWWIFIVFCLIVVLIDYDFGFGLFGANCLFLGIDVPFGGLLFYVICDLLLYC